MAGREASTWCPKLSDLRSVAHVENRQIKLRLLHIAQVFSLPAAPGVAARTLR